MVVDVVSPTPFALLRRAKNFEYRDDDLALQEFAGYDDPVKALTDECRRVLRCISSTNQSTVSSAKASTGLKDASWSRFEDIGFGGTIEESDGDDGDGSLIGRKHISSQTLGTSPKSLHGEFGRPATPSWADFLSSGFVYESRSKTSTPLLLSPDQVLPPIDIIPRGQSSQSHRRPVEMTSMLEPGELASISKLDLDDAFWWVWISSLAGEEPSSRKAVFGRCALIETTITGGKWMIMEEQVKGAAPEPTADAYIAEKKGFLGFTTKRGRLARRKSATKKNQPSVNPYKKSELDTTSRVTIAPDQQAKIQAAAAELQRRNQKKEQATNGVRRGRLEENSASKANSVLTLQPLIINEASSAMKWANQYDKQVVRAQYLGSTFAGKGSSEMLSLPPAGLHANGSVSTFATASKDRDLPLLPTGEDVMHRSPSPAPPVAKSPLAATSAEVPPAVPVEGTINTPSPSREQAPIVHAERVEKTEPVSLSKTGESPSAVRGLAPPTQPRAMQDEPSNGNGGNARKANVPRPPVQAPSHRQLIKKKPPRASGLKGFFGTKRPREAQPAPDHSPSTQANPAIAAARTALESRGPTSPAKPASYGSPTNSRVSKSSDKISAVPMPTATQRSNSPLPPPEPLSAPEPEPVASRSDEAATADDGQSDFPKTRRDEEYEQLSRVDTNEREHAEREFSTFDHGPARGHDSPFAQGPLLEQPAFVPSRSDSPLREEFSTPREEDPAKGQDLQPHHHQPKVSVHSAVTMQAVHPADEPEGAGASRSISPGDRWAQIRKNAADRAARQNEEAGPRSHVETRTEDGETSGEESKSLKPPGTIPC